MVPKCLSYNLPTLSFIGGKKPDLLETKGGKR